MRTPRVAGDDLRPRPGRVRLPQRPEPARKDPLPAVAGRGTAAHRRSACAHHALVAIGGGKDSLVSIEALRRCGRRPDRNWIGGSQLISALRRAHRPADAQPRRALAPQLFDFNREGA
jgi:hypothetical protein